MLAMCLLVCACLVPTPRSQSHPCCLPASRCPAGVCRGWLAAGAAARGAHAAAAPPAGAPLQQRRLGVCLLRAAGGGGCCAVPAMRAVLQWALCLLPPAQGATQASTACPAVCPPPAQPSTPMRPPLPQHIGGGRLWLGVPSVIEHRVDAASAMHGMSEADLAGAGGWVLGGCVWSDCVQVPGKRWWRLARAGRLSLGPTLPGCACRP